MGYSPQGCKESDTTERLHFLSLSLCRERFLPESRGCSASQSTIVGWHWHCPCASSMGSPQCQTELVLRVSCCGSFLTESL